MIDLTKPERPIVCFDLETTGTSVASDRIVSIAMIKLDKELKVDGELYEVVNPGIDIPEAASLIHGLYNHDVAGKPSFRDIAPKVLKFCEDCDLAGYNSNKFDVPLLSSEFYRIGHLGFPAGHVKTFDAMVIFKQAFPQNLEGAYHRYMGKTIKRKEHNALEDTKFLVDVFKKQLEVHNKELKFDTWKGFERFNHYERNYIDIGEKFYLSNEKAYFAFGKHMDRLVSQFPSYLTSFMFLGDFHMDTKIKGALILDGKLSEFMKGRLSQAEIMTIAEKYFTIR